MTAQQLKNSILQMAVQGKLVPQDPNDEPASILLERIRAEKEQLIKAKKIKREKNPSVIFRGADNIPYEKIGDEVRSLEDEVPFDIPDSWEWVRLCNLVGYAMGKTPPRKETEFWSPATAPWVSIADMISDGIITSTKECVSEYAVQQTFKGRWSPAGTLLMSFKLTVGKVSKLGIDAFHNEAIISIWPFIDPDHITTDYLFLTLPLVSQQGDTKSAIKGKTLNSESLDNLLIPLPPISEQKRICAKANEVLPFLQEYEKAFNDNLSLIDNFPERLRKSILQMAVQGKLVPQDPADEPAEVLLERIRAEKERLIKEGKIKRDKHESVIFRRDNSHYEKLDGAERCIDDEIPFEIPENWVWVRFGCVTDYGATRPKINAQNASGDTWCLDLEDIERGGRLLEKIQVKNRSSKGEKTHFSKGDILYSKLRPYLLKMLIAPDDGICTPEIVPFIAYGSIMPQFVLLYLGSPYVDYLINSVTYGVKMPRVGTDTIRQLLFPLPPLSEQQRIVEKIEEILPMIKSL